MVCTSQTRWLTASRAGGQTHTPAAPTRAFVVGCCCWLLRLLLGCCCCCAVSCVSSRDHHQQRPCSARSDSFVGRHCIVASCEREKEREDQVKGEWAIWRGLKWYFRCAVCVDLCPPRCIGCGVVVVVMASPPPPTPNSPTNHVVLMMTPACCVLAACVRAPWWWWWWW